jgi:hypothetical protein
VNVDNLILEHLKRFQDGQERIERKLEEIIARIGQLELGLASLRATPRPLLDRAD